MKSNTFKQGFSKSFSQIIFNSLSFELNVPKNGTVEQNWHNLWIVWSGVFVLDLYV
jgi:hypothetical protein